jgi:hypothetical protein
VAHAHGDQYHGTELVVQHTNFCINVSGASLSSGAGVIQWPCVDASNERVDATNNGDGTYSFEFNHSGMCLSVPGSSTTAGVQLVQESCSGGNNQRFYTAHQTGVYTELKPKHNSSMCVNIEGGIYSGWDQGDSVIQWTCSSPLAVNELWQPTHTTHRTSGSSGSHSSGSHSSNPAHIWVGIGSHVGAPVTSGGTYHDNCSSSCGSAFGGDWALDLGASGGTATYLYLYYAGQAPGGTLAADPNRTMSVYATAQPWTYLGGYSGYAGMQVSAVRCDGLLGRVEWRSALGRDRLRVFAAYRQLLQSQRGPYCHEPFAPEPGGVRNGLPGLGRTGSAGFK